MPRKRISEELTVTEHMRQIASSGGKARAKSLSHTERQEIGKSGGLIGGKARAAKLTQEQRSDIARKAAAARWGKKRSKE